MKQGYKKLVITGCLIAGLVSTVHATAYHRDITQAGSSAEMIGIGSIKGFSNHASVVLESPVGLGYAGNSVTGFYTHYFGGTHYMAGAVSYKISPEFTVGFGVASESNDDLDATSVNDDDEFIVDEKFNASMTQQVLAVEFTPVEKIHFGASWIHYTSDLYEVTGTATDIGLGFRYDAKPGDILVTAKNILGHKMNFSDDSQEKLAAEWSLGFKSKPITHLLHSECFAQVTKTDGVGELTQSLGLKVSPLENKMLQVSLGYKRFPVISKVKDTMTAGLTLNLASVALAYSYDTTDVYNAGQQHYVSLSYSY